MYEVSTMTEDDIAEIHEMYRIPDTFHLHAPGLGYRVTSNPTNHLAIYKEDLCIDLRFPLHDFIWNVLISIKSSLHNLLQTLFVSSPSVTFLESDPDYHYSWLSSCWRNFPGRGVGGSSALDVGGLSLAASQPPFTIEKIDVFHFFQPTMENPVKLGRTGHFIK